jgi:hypothetical protein
MPFNRAFLYLRGMEFSHALVSRYQRYMEKRCGVYITCEQAQIQLASLAQLYISFAFSKEADVGRVRFSPQTDPEGR